MAFNMLDQTVLPYPRGKTIEKVTLIQWFDKVLLKSNPENLKQKNDHLSLVDDKIYDLSLSSTPILVKANFSTQVLEEGHDVVVLLYNTDSVIE